MRHGPAGIPARNQETNEYAGSYGYFGQAPWSGVTHSHTDGAPLSDAWVGSEQHASGESQAGVHCEGSASTAPHPVNRPTAMPTTDTLLHARIATPAPAQHAGRTRAWQPKAVGP